MSSCVNVRYFIFSFGINHIFYVVNVAIWLIYQEIVVILVVVAWMEYNRLSVFV
jgi:hypothetical protein